MNLECLKCGTTKAGKPSCCGRGGTWVGKCGSDANFDHTWDEGMEVCKIERKCNNAGSNG